MKYVAFYLVLVNLIGMIITVYDKLAAIKNKRRISERCLFVYAIIGAAPIMYITMRSIRHKTLHKSFMIGFPLIVVLQLSLAAFLIYKFA